MTEPEGEFYAGINVERSLDGFVHLTIMEESELDDDHIIARVMSVEITRADARRLAGELLEASD